MRQVSDVIGKVSDVIRHVSDVVGEVSGVISLFSDVKIPEPRTIVAGSSFCDVTESSPGSGCNGVIYSRNRDV